MCLERLELCENVINIALLQDVMTFLMLNEVAYNNLATMNACLHIFHFLCDKSEHSLSHWICTYTSCHIYQCIGIAARMLGGR